MTAQLLVGKLLVYCSLLAVCALLTVPTLVAYFADDPILALREQRGGGIAMYAPQGSEDDDMRFRVSRSDTSVTLYTDDAASAMYRDRQTARNCSSAGPTTRLPRNGLSSTCR